MEDIDFGKLLAKMVGVDLEELEESVRLSQDNDISERMHFNLNDELVYIKNSYEYFNESETHYINPNPQKHDPYNEKIASYLTLKNLKQTPDLDNAISDLEDYFEYDAEIKEFLFKNDYIESREFGEGFWDYVYEINTYDDLKTFLDDENIDSSGSKRDLVNRAKELHLYEELNEFEFKPSYKGRKYLVSISWIEYYLIFLDRFDFYEFEDYYEPEMEFMPQALSFIDLHLNSSFKNYDFIAFFDALSSKALYYIVNGDYVNALAEEMKVFLTRVNPISDDIEEDLVFHHPLDRVNIDNIKNLIEITGTSDLESLFNDNWDSMRFNQVFFERNESFEIFIKALKSDYCEDLNPELEEVYFE